MAVYPLILRYLIAILGYVLLHENVVASLKYLSTTALKSGHFLFSCTVTCILKYSPSLVL